MVCGSIVKNEQECTLFNDIYLSGRERYHEGRRRVRPISCVGNNTFNVFRLHGFQGWEGGFKSGTTQAWQGTGKQDHATQEHAPPAEVECNVKGEGQVVEATQKRERESMSVRETKSHRQLRSILSWVNIKSFNGA